MSKPARPSTQQPAAPRSMTAAARSKNNIAARGAHGSMQEKENQPSPAGRRSGVSESTIVPSKRPANDDDDYDDEDDCNGHNDVAAEHFAAADGDYDEDSNAIVMADGRAAEPFDNEEEYEEQAPPSRGSRTRRVSTKQAQYLAEREETEARKAAKAAKAAKKQCLQDGEEEDELIPLQDTQFTFREVDARPERVKVLAQRNNRVPTTQARLAVVERGRTHESSQDLRHIIANNRTSGSKNNAVSAYQGPADRAPETPCITGSRLPHDTSNWRRSAVTPRPIESSDDDQRPRSINGHVFPQRVQLDLRRRCSPSYSRSRSRSRSPASGDKRTHSPEADLRPTQAQKINDYAGRPRAKDYDDTTQELLAIAIDSFRCRISAINGFPDHQTEAEFVKQSWAKACLELNVMMPITPVLAKLITRRGPQVRGELKTKVRALVELVHGFESGQNKTNVRKNRVLAEDLKEGSGTATRHEFPADPARRIKDLSGIGSFHSGAQPIEPIATSTLSTAALDAAIKEYEEDEDTESDGEDGFPLRCICCNLARGR
ncbi:hypothetical protein B0H10DRAFT_2222932 [Mycena sp. CBHHK59/15]|nr:hypothetical protein B0H10DRAFT_2222932 [Mycena sp. CBHHK59/15]